MNRSKSVILMIVFAIIVYNFWDFNISWHWILLLGYLSTSILFGIYLIFENPENSENSSWALKLGFAWPVYVIGGLASIKSEHDRTQSDHKK